MDRNINQVDQNGTQPVEIDRKEEDCTNIDRQIVVHGPELVAPVNATEQLHFLLCNIF